MRCEVKRLQAARPPITSSFFSRISFSSGRASPTDFVDVPAEGEMAAGVACSCARTELPREGRVAKASQAIASELGFRIASSKAKNIIWPIKSMEGLARNAGRTWNFVVKWRPACRAGERTVANLARNLGANWERN